MRHLGLAVVVLVTTATTVAAQGVSVMAGWFSPFLARTMTLSEESKFFVSQRRMPNATRQHWESTPRFI